MGGYAAYVWTAYAVTAIGLAGLGLASWRRMRALESRADRLRAARRSERGQA
ncbi:heme exporter protein CcmD [Pedomonas sp. V897]|uniref:heme exporter protein CcmD n=1 Tax=Pedomonas sp. V897 TaxID=3446482 RepID=UPI003EE270C0